MATKKKKAAKKSKARSVKTKHIQYAAVVTDEPQPETIFTTASTFDREGDDSRYFASWIVLEILADPDNINLVNSIFDTCSDEENANAQAEFYMAAQVLKNLTWAKPFPDDIFGPCDDCGVGGCTCKPESSETI